VIHALCSGEEGEGWVVGEFFFHQGRFAVGDVGEIGDDEIEGAGDRVQQIALEEGDVGDYEF
jgi:hypothetical protein